MPRQRVLRQREQQQHRRAQKNSNTEAPIPVRTATPTTSEPSRAPLALPLATSSFTVVTDSPTIAPVLQDKSVDGVTTDDEDVGRSIKRRRRLLAILLPLLLSSLIVAVVGTFVLMRWRQRYAAETYAELESESASSSSLTSGERELPDGDGPPPPPDGSEAIAKAPQFTLPRLGSFRSISSRRSKQASDKVVMQVERLEIGDVSKVIYPEGITFLGGAFQLSWALEEAIRAEVLAKRPTVCKATISSGESDEDRDLANTTFSTEMESTQSETSSASKEPARRSLGHSRARVDKRSQEMKLAVKKCDGVSMLTRSRINRRRIRRGTQLGRRLPDDHLIADTTQSSSSLSPIAPDDESRWIEFTSIGLELPLKPNESVELKPNEPIETDFTMSETCSI